MANAAGVLTDAEAPGHADEHVEVICLLSGSRFMEVKDGKDKEDGKDKAAMNQRHIRE